MENKSEVSEQNFAKGKAVHYLWKLSFMIKNSKMWREVTVLNFFLI